MAQEKWLVSGPKVIDLEVVRKLKVALVGGQVDIVAHDEPSTRVEVHSVIGRELKISLDGDTLSVDHPQLSWDNWLDAVRSFKGTAKADLSIMVPRTAALRLGVVTAEALVSGLADDAVVSTVGGSVVVDSVTGDLQLNAVNAELAVRNHTGNVSVNTVSGDVTVSGAVHRFSSDGVSGDVFLDLSGTPDDVRVNTVSGSVTMRLDDGVPARYRIHTVSGKLQLDDGSVRGVRGKYTGTHGQLDKAWVDFVANTVSGDVSVLHAVRV
jgi:Putative adhesin